MKFDAIIVGAGQVGPPLAARLASEGRRVAVVERKFVGGTCVNYGCIPTKTLVASAHAAHVARRAGDFGVDTGEVRVDIARVKARKGRNHARRSSWGRDMVGGNEWLHPIRGHARFEGPQPACR